jgi:thiol-disulfide isomerase/thioredoxin
MSAILSLLYNKYLRKSSTIILVIIVSILFIALGYYGYKKYYLEKLEAKEFKNVANANKRKQNVDIYFFHANWCPHCKSAKPEWIQFKEEYHQKVVNNYTINCIEVDCSDENDQKSAILIKQYKIEGYPTIIMLVNDNRIDYDAKVSKHGLEQLVLSGTAK